MGPASVNLAGVPNHRPIKHFVFIHKGRMSLKVFGVLGTALSHVSIPKSEWHDGQRWINDSGTVTGQVNKVDSSGKLGILFFVCLLKLF